MLGDLRFLGEPILFLKIGGRSLLGDGAVLGRLTRADGATLHPFLNPLARSYLREAFRAVESVQANLSAELSLGVRWG